MPSKIKNAAEMEVPIIPPTVLKESNLSLIAEEVAATTMEVTTTILPFGQSQSDF